MSKEQLAKNRVSYLSKKEWSNFENNYNSKNTRKSLKILQGHDPVAELLNILDTKYVKKDELDNLCRRFLISEEVRSKLENLVQGTRTKMKGNSLSHLLDRITNLEIIFIGKENIAMDLWENENPFLEKHIFNLYMEDRHVKMATEMMILDIQNLFPKKMKEWEKSCGLFQGIDLRNVIAHEDVIIQNICEWFDPSDVPKDIVRIVINFFKDKRAIINMLTLFEKADEDFTKFSILMELEGKENGLVNEENERYKKYVKLLPGATKQTKIVNECMGLV